MNVHKNLQLYKLDLHIHTKYSDDSSITAEELISACKSNEVVGVAITDHNSIKGINHFRKKLEKEHIIVIAGEEISTASGHLIGLYIEKEIKPHLTLDETIDAIEDQNGISILPHPYRFPHRVKGLQNIEDIDLVESRNGRSTEGENKNAEQLAMKYKKATTGGSDSHSSSYIGSCYTYVNNTDNLYEEIKKGNCYGSGKSITYLKKVDIWRWMAEKWILRGGKAI
ncbi:MAG: CehA/McbA family metallohydrolase [Candidatus Thermoplasmatota archaeon]|nr:CehA/McbA family metallohydrolase [Candidatus Thermoplasmatota archaeon]MCL5962971.1 CehA/McbA family metallohydrolase [Candidatus Thermoplasmatota archaeon]